MSYRLYTRLPDESRSLPPPRLFNFGSTFMGFVGWLSALLDNGLNQRPILRAGVHRQVLLGTISFYIGHYFTKRTAYTNAKRDREMNQYIRHHPEDFKAKEKRTMAEVLENFHPIK